MSDILPLAQFIVDSLRLDSFATNVDLPAEVDWAALIDHADAHSLTPMLWSAWSRSTWLRRIPFETLERVARALRDNMNRQSNIKAEFLEIDALLTAAQVPHITLKGYPLAEHLYTDPAHRVIYDHDFLVPPQAAATGHQALLAAGFKPLPAKDEWIEKHLPPVWRNDGYQWDGYLFDPKYPRPVELHVRLWEKNWRGLQVNDLPDIWRDAQTQTVAGREIQTLSVEDTIGHLGMHFAGHLIEREARLSQLLDLARAVQQSKKIDWDQVINKTTTAGVARFVYASLYLAHKIFGVLLPPAEIWQRLDAETPPAFRSWLSTQGVNDVLVSNYRRRNKGKDYELTFMAAGSLFERAGILRFAAVPPLGQLMTKYNVRHRWLAALMYPRYIADRLKTYGS